MVRSDPRVSGGNVGSVGSCCRRAERISTLLMLSIPRSASRSKSVPIADAGYPVFSATISTRVLMSECGGWSCVSVETVSEIVSSEKC